MSEEDHQKWQDLARRSFKFTIETMPHGGYVVSEAGDHIHAASNAADLCYWLESVLSHLDVKPESTAANPLPSFLVRAKEAAKIAATALITRVDK